MSMQNRSQVIQQIFGIQLLLMIFISLFSIYYFSFGFNPASMTPLLCQVVTLLVFWNFWSWRKLSCQTFDLYSVFLMATAAFNCGQIFLQVLNLNPEGILMGKFSDQTIFETILYVGLGLTSMHLGAILKMNTQRDYTFKAEPLPSRELFDVGIFLVFISVIPTVLVMRELIQVVSASGYFGIYERQDQIGMNNLPVIISGLFAPGMVFLMASWKLKPRILPWIDLAFIGQGLLFTILGRRADGASLLLIYAIARHTFVNPISRKVVIVASAVMIAVVFPLIGVVRNLDLNQRSDLGFMWDTFQSLDSPAVAALTEMGGSMQAISHTIDLLPKVRNYDLVASYFYSALSIVPNFFWDLHPSVARGSPSVWLVKTVEPDIAALGGGIGYSYIAETYLNFGWVGGPIVMLLLGYALAGLVAWSQLSGDPAKIAAALSFFTSALSFARADSQSIIRPLIWYSLIPYLLVIILKKIREVDSVLPKSLK
ncbi:MAG: O-antigen polysaccharide polymerase Wzy [Pseudobdellovibrionaceae bacterium]